MHLYLRKHGCGFLALLFRGIIQQVWLKGVEFGQLVHRKVPLNLLLVHNPEWQRLFGYLPLINLLLHCALKRENEKRWTKNRGLKKHQVAQESIRITQAHHIHPILDENRGINIKTMQQEFQVQFSEFITSSSAFPNEVKWWFRSSIVCPAWIQFYCLPYSKRCISLTAQHKLVQSYLEVETERFSPDSKY